MDLHRHLLEDRGTQSRFVRAIREAVRPGDVVLDLGTGSGIHALVACRAGAARVYAVDRDDVVEVAGEVARRNGCADRVICLQGAFPRVSLPERVDLVVTNQGFADAIRLLARARARVLAPRGRVLPAAVRFAVAPVECPQAYEAAVSFWQRGHYGFDFAPFHHRAVNGPHEYNFTRRHLLGAAVRLPRIEFGAPIPPVFSWSARFAVTRAGTLHGIGAWFEYRLSPHVTLSTGPPMVVASPPWTNMWLPLADAPRVRAGDRVEVDLRLSVEAEWNLWAWHTTLRRRARGAWTSLFAERHSSVDTFPFSKGLLARVSPDARPRLDEWGQARRAVLTLCNGRRRIADIERRIQAAYPALFVSTADAQGFVAEVLTRGA